MVGPNKWEQKFQLSPLKRQMHGSGESPDFMTRKCLVLEVYMNF